MISIILRGLPILQTPNDRATNGAGSADPNSNSIKSPTRCPVIVVGTALTKKQL